MGFTCFFFLFDLVLFLFVVVVVVVVVVVGGPFSFCLPSTKKQKIQFDSVRDAIGQSDRSINRFLSTVLCGAGPLRCVSISVGLRSGIVRHLFLAHSGKRPAHLKRWPIKKEKPRVTGLRRVFFCFFFLVGFKRVHFLFFLRVASDFQVRADRRESSTFLVEPRRKKERERERRKREKEETMERGGFD